MLNPHGSIVFYCPGLVKFYSAARAAVFGFRFMGLLSVPKVSHGTEGGR